ncbi:heterokaryon incompatibility protein [Botrytis cinerea]
MLSRLLNSTLERLSVKEESTPLESPKDLYPTLSFPPPHPVGKGTRSICARCLTLLSHMIKLYGDGTKHDKLQIVHSQSIQVRDFRPRHRSVWIHPKDDPEEDPLDENCVICAKIRILFDAMQVHVSFEPSLRDAPYEDWSLTWAGNIDIPDGCLSVLVTAKHKGGFSWGIGGFKVYPGAENDTVQIPVSEETSRDYPVIVPLDLQDSTVQDTNIVQPESVAFCSTVSAGTMTGVRLWTQNCTNSHTKCRRIFRNGGKDQYEPESDWFPDRLLKITRDDTEPGYSDISARLVLRSDPDDFLPGWKGLGYVSLSHSWGPSPDPSAPLGGRVGAVLTESNLALWRVDLPLDDLPLTFRHAIIVCVSLGFQYIWIDSLCIIQDSLEDWKEQSAMMRDVYKFAWLNIAALSTASDYEGFINEYRDPRVEFGFRASFASILGHDLGQQNADNGDCLLLSGVAKLLWNFSSDIPGNTVSNAPLFKRAWVYQERSLARRTLAFAKNSVYWACDEHTGGEQPEWSGIEGSSLRRTLHSVRETSALNPPSEEQLLRLLKEFETTWQSTVASYTRCKLTKSIDKLIAVSSVAQELAEMMPQRYLAGLYDFNLVYQMTWVNIDGRTTPPRKRVGDSEYVAPSWSWASVEAPIHKYIITASGVSPKYESTPGTKQFVLANVLAADVALETEYLFGLVKAGWMRIRGRLNRVTASYKRAPSWNAWENSVSLIDEHTGQGLWFTGDTVEAYELIRWNMGIRSLVWMPLLISFDSTVSCQCIFLVEVDASDQIGDDGKFVKPGEKVYRRVGSGHFGRVTSSIYQDKLLMELGTYPVILQRDGLGQILANGFKRSEDGFEQIVII